MRQFHDKLFQPANVPISTVYIFLTSSITILKHTPHTLQPCVPGCLVTPQNRNADFPETSYESHCNKSGSVQAVGRLTLTWSNVFCSPLPCLRRWKSHLNGLCTGWGIRLLSGFSFCQSAQGFSVYLVCVLLSVVKLSDLVLLEIISFCNFRSYINFDTLPNAKPIKLDFYFAS